MSTPTQDESQPGERPLFTSKTRSARPPRWAASIYKKLAMLEMELESVGVISPDLRKNIDEIERAVASRALRSAV